MERRAWAANIVFGLIMMLSLCLHAAAQDTTYSPDSLMAAFKKNGPVSLKGTAVTLSGVVAENSKSRVVFKSSGNDKVICELVSTANAVVGSPLTVAGKVKGRGMLGNITLDQCHPLEPSAAVPEEPAVVEPAQPVQEVSETTAEPQNADVPVLVADSVLVSPRTLPSSKQTLRTDNTAKTAAVADPVAVDRLSAPAEAVANATNEAANQTRESRPGPAVYYILIGLVAGVGVVLAFQKLRPFFVGLFATNDGPKTEEMRRAALEALLAADKKRAQRRLR